MMHLPLKTRSNALKQKTTEETEEKKTREVMATRVKRDLLRDRSGSNPFGTINESARVAEHHPKGLLAAELLRQVGLRG